MGPMHDVGTDVGAGPTSDPCLVRNILRCDGARTTEPSSTPMVATRESHRLGSHTEPPMAGVDALLRHTQSRRPLHLDICGSANVHSPNRTAASPRLATNCNGAHGTMIVA